MFCEREGLVAGKEGLRQQGAWNEDIFYRDPGQRCWTAGLMQLNVGEM